MSDGSQTPPGSRPDQGDGLDLFDEDGADSETPKRRRTGLKIALASVGLVLLLVVGGVGGYLIYLNSIVSGNVTHESLLPTWEAGEGDPSAGPQPTREATSGEALNILLLGSDSRDPEEDGGRSDVMILAHIDSEREGITLIHFPRDYFVDIPGNGTNKINAAYAIGGPQLLVQTLQPLIGVPIDHMAMTDFESFISMTDAVGGVEVNVTQASPGFPEGPMQMDGEQALEFVRERYALNQGDISRGQRQQEFLKSLMLKGLSSSTLTNPGRLADFVDAATSNLVVDESLQVSDMRNLAFELRGIRGGDIRFLTAPWTGIGSDPVAGSTVEPNEELLADLAEHLQQDTLEDYVDDSSPTSGY